MTHKLTMRGPRNTGPLKIPMKRVMEAAAPVPFCFRRSLVLFRRFSPKVGESGGAPKGGRHYSIFQYSACQVPIFAVAA